MQGKKLQMKRRLNLLPRNRKLILDNIFFFSLSLGVGSNDCPPKDKTVVHEGVQRGVSSKASERVRAWSGETTEISETGASADQA